VVDIQVKVGGEWKYQPRLVSWYGPCDYSYSGLVMEKNLNWAPELLDLLHRYGTSLISCISVYTGPVDL
jgi:hypothetical protein